jgi:hypothetical protein
MRFSELENDQRRQLIDAQQLFSVWREAAKEFRHSYQGSMHWRRKSGTDYLYRIYPDHETSLGRRSPETEQVKSSYTEQRTSLKQRVTKTRNRIEKMAVVNRAYRLGRMPLAAAKVLRELDEAGVLGRSAFVVGTHALFAYECMAGIVFDGALTATTDLDLLWDVRKRLTLAVVDGEPDSVLGILRRADKSYVSKSAPFRASNDAGFMVDFIRPERANESYASDPSLTAADTMAAQSIAGLQWLVNAPKIEQIIIAEDGRPLWVSSIDPRVFALHKYWVSKQTNREATKRTRDAQQAIAVAALATQYLQLDFKAKELSAIPKALTELAKTVQADAQR